MKAMLGGANPNWPPAPHPHPPSPPSPSGTDVANKNNINNNPEAELSPPSASTDPTTSSTSSSSSLSSASSSLEPSRRRIGSSPALLLRRHSTVAAIDEEDEEATTTTILVPQSPSQSSPPLPTPNSHRSDTNNNHNPTNDQDDPLVQLLLLSDQQPPSTHDDAVFAQLPATPIASRTPTPTSDDVPLKCIFLCEFHAIAGPTIAAQVPAGYITKDVFAIVNRYIIPKLQLERSFLSVNLLGHKILGYPVRIDNPQLYARNAFYFNVCFVFEPTTRTTCYEPVVRKLTEYMLSMELSSQLLSQRTDIGRMARLTRLLARIRDDLNQRRMCLLQEGSTIIPLCVVPQLPSQQQAAAAVRHTISSSTSSTPSFTSATSSSPAIQPHAAAVLNGEFYKHVYSQWDLTTLRILPYVNGFNHAARISTMADVAMALVLDCLKHLVVLGVAIAVPVFQYNNVYRPTPKLSQLAKCPLLQQRCLAQCSKSDRNRATVRDVFRMFASMAHGATFGELCVRCNPAALNINEKQMVLFGLVEGLIRRVDRYPVTVSRNLFIDDDVMPHHHVHQHLLTAHHHRAATRPLPRGERWNPRGIQHTIKSTVAKTQFLGQPSPSSSHQPQPQRPFQHYWNTGPPSGGGFQASHTHQTPQQQSHRTPTTATTFFYNGLKSLDEICCARGISCQQLEQQLARDRHVIVLLK